MAASLLQLAHCKIYIYNDVCDGHVTWKIKRKFYIDIKKTLWFLINGRGHEKCADEKLR